MPTAPKPVIAKGRYPPGPSFLPRLLTGKVFRANATDYLTECARTYGDLVHYRAVGRHIYQINSPALIEDFFLKDAAKHHRGLVIKRSVAVLGQGLLTSEEPLHMRQRRLAQPAFHRNRDCGIRGRDWAAGAGDDRSLEDGGQRSMCARRCWRSRCALWASACSI